jgi:putative spermidine/putrescine transport system ATP-binding protein
MNHGVIEQLAAPQEIYDHPATEFVAQFIGDTNFIEADGERVAVRPERVRLGTAGSGLRATVITRMIIGATVQWVVRLDDGQEILARLQRSGDAEAESFGDGDEVFVSWAAGEALELTGGRTT